MSRVRFAGRRDQSVLRRDAHARRNQSRPGAPRRRRLAYGGRVRARESGQHRRVRRHLRTRGHRHDHRALLGVGRFDSYPVHHGPGAPRAPLQGRLPGRRHRIDREARHQVGGHRARAGAGAARVPAGVPPDAIRPAGSGADRPAGRRADGRDRIRPRHVFVAAGVQTQSDARADRKGDGHARAGAMPSDRRRRWHHQRRRSRFAGPVRRDDRRSGHSYADGLGCDPGRSSADGRNGWVANGAPLWQRDHARLRFRARRRQPLGEPPHRVNRRVHAGTQVRPRRHRAHADRSRVRTGSWHRVRREGRTRALRRCRAGIPARPQAARLLGLGPSVPRTQADAAAAHRLRQRAGQAAARLRRDEQGVRRRCLLRHHDRAVADRGGTIPARAKAAALDPPP